MSSKGPSLAVKPMRGVSFIIFLPCRMSEGLSRLGGKAADLNQHLSKGMDMRIAVAARSQLRV